MTRLQAPIVEMVSLAIGLPILVTGIVTLVIKPLALVTRKVSRPQNYWHQWLEQRLWLSNLRHLSPKWWLWPLNHQHQLLNDESGHQAREIGHWSSGFDHWNVSTYCITHQTDDLAIIWGEVKSQCVFVKCFTKVLKIKCLTTFDKRFYCQGKIFYKFNHILHAN